MDTLGGWMSEIRYFYLMQARRPVSVPAQALWNYLMYRANGVWWAMPMALRAGEIQGAMGMTETSFKRARKELEKNKLLVVEPQGGSRPSHYYVMSCVNPGMAVGPSLTSRGMDRKGEDAKDKKGF